MKTIGLIAVLFALTATGCGGSMDLSSDWDPEADFTNLNTYQFAERVSREDDDPRVYNDITEQRIRNAINTALQARGYELVTTGEPDFKVGWHGSIDKRMNMETVHNDYNYHTTGWVSPHDPRAPQSKTYVNEWEEGTLIIDVIDPKKNELMWRGTGTALVDEDVSAEKDQSNLNDAVAKILKAFPPQQ
ncbi:MAG: DUF4136 domain-containing protein [Candidatus Latescibacterota bacterium]|nr:MAG: DUF4136 domain-containing protein [Candidatus Latescibacterota bacterium]